MHTEQASVKAMNQNLYGLLQLKPKFHLAANSIETGPLNCELYITDLVYF